MINPHPAESQVTPVHRLHRIERSSLQQGHSPTGVENSKIGYNPRPPYLVRKMMTFHVNWGGSFLHKQTCNNLMAGYELLAKVLAKTEYNMYIL